MFVPLLLLLSLVSDATESSSTKPDRAQEHTGAVDTEAAFSAGMWLPVRDSTLLQSVVNCHGALYLD